MIVFSSFCPTYSASRSYIFAVWAGVWKVASADNRSIFDRVCAKFVTRFVTKINSSGLWSNGASCAGIKKNCDNSDLLRITHARLTRCSKPVKSRKNNPVFVNLFAQISGRIRTVVGRGYFSHDSSHSENVASARRVVQYGARLFNNYSSSPNLLWVNSPWSQRPNEARGREELF